ncbi:MAG: hypothetical protein K0A98_00245 [Trueperaceae bacterium]|nr:hypothetical protein [Trueperaceae bacterium]
MLNPGGGRIGTAEIYRQVEKVPEVLASPWFGQPWGGDVRVVLFVRLRGELTLDRALVERICATAREHATPRHVPAVVLQVPDLPRTKSGKLDELAVRSVAMGERVRNLEALANPEALDLCRDRPGLRAGWVEAGDAGGCGIRGSPPGRRTRHDRELAPAHGQAPEPGRDIRPANADKKNRVFCANFTSSRAPWRRAWRSEEVPDPPP